MLLNWLTMLATTLAPGADAPGAEAVDLNAYRGLLPGTEILGVNPARELLPGCEVRASGPPEYYAIELVPTRQVTGTGRTAGSAEVTFDTTPFGVSLAPDGSYSTTLHVQVNQLPARQQGAFVAWATTPSIDEVVRIGVLDEDGFAKGRVEWNKFIVVVTFEADASADADSWSGPIVLRGMSRSGMMHTMAGHGPFERQECAAFGY